MPFNLCYNIMYTKKIFVIPFNLCTWICNTTVNFRIHIDINKIHRKAKDIEDLIIYIDYGLDSFVAKKLAGKQYRVNFFCCLVTRDSSFLQGIKMYLLSKFRLFIISLLIIRIQKFQYCIYIRNSSRKFRNWL